MKTLLQRLAAAPFLFLLFLVTGQEHPTRPKGCRHLLEDYL